MDIREACEDIMGERLASNIIADPTLGLAWCVVAAMADPRNGDKPRACAVIRTGSIDHTFTVEQESNMIQSGTKAAKGYEEPSGLVQIAVRIPKDVFERMKAFAIKDNVSIAAKIRDYIEVGVEVDHDMANDPWAPQPKS